MVDLVPTFESAKRPLGPDGKPLPREIVIPGQMISDGDVRPGIGAYTRDGSILAANLGIKIVDGGYASVIPIGGRYLPVVGNVVIGRIIDVGPSNWLIEINSLYPAPMHVNEVPWHVEFGETTNYLKAGDSVTVRISKLTEVGRVQVSMEGPGLRKLQGGQLIEIPHSKIPRVIGKNGSMIALIKKYTSCRLVVGQNGRIWIAGDPDDILIVLRTIQMTVDEVHVHGLTDRVKAFLQKEKGIDPEVEAEEERKEAERREAERKEAERKEAQRKEAARKGEAEEAEAREKDRQAKEAKAEVEKKEEEEVDDLYDGYPDDELCKDPENGSDGIVTILAPDGESLMVVEDEDLPVCDTKEESNDKKEDH